MHTKKILGILIFLFSAHSTMAAQRTLFTLHRKNYKPEKQLRYILKYDSKTCSIRSKRPLKVYYENKKTKQPLAEFSDRSREYFGPHWKSSQLKKQEFHFQFKAFRQMSQILGSRSRIIVQLEKVGKKCVIKTWGSTGKSKIDLKHISIMFNKIAGYPTSVKKVTIYGKNSQGRNVTKGFRP